MTQYTLCTESLLLAEITEVVDDGDITETEEGWEAMVTGAVAETEGAGLALAACCRFRSFPVGPRW